MGRCIGTGCDRSAVARGMCRKHYGRWFRLGGQTGYPSEEERLWAKIDKNGPVAALRPDLGRCWLWTGGLDARGYGVFDLSRRRGQDGGRRQQAHRAVYIAVKGPVPNGLDLDHFACELHACVNPDHVRPASHRENLLRSKTNFAALHLAKTHCIHGHEFTPENTRIYRGARCCRACHREYEARRRAGLRSTS